MQKIWYVNRHLTIGLFLGLFWGIGAVDDSFCLMLGPVGVKLR